MNNKFSIGDKIRFVPHKIKDKHFLSVYKKYFEEGKVYEVINTYDNGSFETYDDKNKRARPNSQYFELAGEKNEI